MPLPPSRPTSDPTSLQYASHDDDKPELTAGDPPTAERLGRHLGFLPEQVLTPAEHCRGENGFANQEPASPSAVPCGIVSHLTVRQRGDSSEAKGPRNSRSSGGKTRRQSSSNQQRRGGWRSTSFVSHALHRETREKAGILAHAGYPFTVLATARAPVGMTNAEAKRHICRSFSRLGQALERKGHVYVGLTVYEKPVGSRLHGHQLLYVRREGLPVVVRWADRFDDRPLEPGASIESVDLHARRAVPSDLFYVLKEHQWAGPSYRKYRRFYQKAEPIAGPRVSFTKTAKAIIRAAEQIAAPGVIDLQIHDEPSPEIAASETECAQKARVESATLAQPSIIAGASASVVISPSVSLGEPGQRDQSFVADRGNQDVASCPPGEDQRYGRFPRHVHDHPTISLPGKKAHKLVLW